MFDIEEVSLFVPPAQESPHHILNRLNDDCFQEIFESADLALLDLWTLTKVCRRFSPIAARVIEAKHRQFKNFPTEVIPSDWPFEEFLQTFGASIEGFGTVRLNDEECALVSEHCPNVKHVSCSLRDQDSVDQLYGLFGRLESLDIFMRINAWSLEDLKSVSLAKLFIVHLGLYDTHLKLPKRNLPALTEIDLRCIPDGNEEFYRRNKQLQKIGVVVVYNGPGRLDYRCFSDFQSLRELKLVEVASRNDALELLNVIANNGIQLISIQIDHCSWNNEREAFNVLERIKTLQRLDVKYFNFDNAASSLARNLLDLEELKLSSHSHEWGLRGMRQFMENAGEKLKKVIYIYRIKFKDCKNPPDEMEFNRMAAVAQRRGIDLHMEIVLDSRYDEAGWFNYEYDVSGICFRGLFHIKLRRCCILFNQIALFLSPF